MTDQDTATDDQVSDDAVQSNAATDAATSDTGTDSVDQASIDDEPWDRERGMNTIRKQREDIRKQRDELKAATRALKELEALRSEKKAADEAKLSEQERLTKRAADLERELEEQRKHNRDLTNRSAVQRAATKLNIVDPDAAERLLDWKAVEYDPAGNPTNLDEVLNDLIEAKPYLVPKSADPQRQPAGNPGNPATRTAAPGTRRYSATQIADRAFYLANKEDINRALREGRIDDN